MSLGSRMCKCWVAGLAVAVELTDRYLKSVDEVWGKCKSFVQHRVQTLGPQARLADLSKLDAVTMGKHGLALALAGDLAWLTEIASDATSDGAQTPSSFPMISGD